MATAPFGVTLDVFSPILATLTDPQRVLLQAAWMRLNTRRGTYWDAPEYGLLVSDFLNDDVRPESLGEISSLVKAQLEQDERLEAAIVDAEIRESTAGDVAIRLGIRLVPNEGEEFSFIFNVSDQAVEVLTQELPSG